MSSHLTNSESHLSGKNYTATKAKSNAEALKDQGNAKFQQHAYQEAIQLYSKAISAAPGVATYYGNRAAAWLMVGANKECVSDCRHAISLDPAYVRGHIRLAKALCEMSEVDSAAEHLQRAVTLCQDKTEISDELRKMKALSHYLAEAKKSLVDGDNARAMELYTESMRHTGCAAAALGAARAETGLGRVDRALKLTLQVIRADKYSVEAYALRGLALCLKGDFDQGTKHLKEALRLDPDSADAAPVLRRMKRAAASLQRARDAAAKRDFTAAVDDFTDAAETADAPEHAPLVATLFGERGAARLRLKEYDTCLADCARAIAAQEDYKPAYFTMGTALQALGRPQEAVEALEALARMDPSDETVRRHYEKAQFEVRKAKRPDYYAVLGVSKIASVPEIKTAYKARAMEWHPDKHAQKGEEEKAEAERMFKAIGEALEVMDDPMKRQLYDEGYDKEAIAERVEMAKRAAHRHGEGGARRLTVFVYSVPGTC